MMIDARTTRRNGSPSWVRAQRSAAAAVAEYVHERSERHADTGGRRAGGRRQQSNSLAKDPITQDAKEAPGAQNR
jgi:hypothetical protein